MIEIVIVNWNSGDFLSNCVLSILKSPDYILVEKIIIVDNDSTDDSLTKVIGCDKIELIINKQNNGFAKACNQGFRACSSSYVLLLNPDTIILQKTLSDCLNFMNEHTDVDILGCTLLDEKGNPTKSCARFPTPIRFFFDAVGLSKIAPGIFTPGTLMTDWSHTESKFVDQVMGAFMFMKGDIFKKFGYFDEQYFVYYEELDFSFGVSKSGGKTYFNAGIKAMHFGEGTTSSVKAFRLFLSLQSRLKYAKKHFSGAGYLLVCFSTFFVEPVSRFILLVFQKKFDGIKQLLKAYKMLLTS